MGIGRKTTDQRTLIASQIRNFADIARVYKFRLFTHGYIVTFGCMLSQIRLSEVDTFGNISCHFVP